ncbi:hypothetical protein BDN70DRAFT_964179 [Pholiota conissans]|uniref:Uncharacterized protein n=1 Tax=Pholiota conissans TaxID=109636 RepID=A0A9P5YTG1_9AGAR|nr:hypothetical protein BDN70DRAFT_964179 [Pholiota conissans]
MKFPGTVKGLFQDSTAPDPSPNGPKWTAAHGFFLQMGGFMLSDHGKPIHTLFDGSRQEIPEDKRLIYNIQRQLVEPPQVTAEDIGDRSKGNAISKTVIILQTTWFVGQCIARWSQNLAVTQLEVITLGFSMLNGITYLLWWQKPQDVGRPVFLERKYHSSPPSSIITLPKVDDWVPHVDDDEQGSEVGLKHHAEKARRGSWLPDSDAEHFQNYRVPIFYAVNIAHDTILITIPIIAVLFASVHLIPSWFLDFSTHLEMWLWRGAAFIITIQPILLGFLVCLDACGLQDLTFTAKIADILIFSFPLYPISRIVLFILSLISLRSPAPSALLTIEWTTFIPHL